MRRSEGVQSTCYMCGRAGTTIEHAPPRCIFPESKDSPPGVDYRKNLITVPSCVEHNTMRSKDDEYLLHVLAVSVTSSEVGLTQFLTKVRRALERNPRLVSSIQPSDTPTAVYVPVRSAVEDAYAVRLDGARIDKVMTSCALALYFHETGTKFSGTVKVVGSFMSYGDSDTDKARAEAFAFAKMFLSTSPAKGENPEIFQYRLQENANIAGMLLSFYRGTEFLVQFDKR